MIGEIAGSLIGGFFGNKAAKHQANADRYATEMQMAPFRLKEPFLAMFTVAHKAH